MRSMVPSMISARTRLPGTAEAGHYSFTIDRPVLPARSSKVRKRGVPGELRGWGGRFQCARMAMAAVTARAGEGKSGETTNDEGEGDCCMGVGEEGEDRSCEGW